MYTEWSVEFSNQAEKQVKKLEIEVQSALLLLVKDLTTLGPFPGKNWPNYSKLKTKKNEDCRHCHLIKGKPTYVCCWEVIDKKVKIIEVYYVGTHENSPY